MNEKFECRILHTKKSYSLETTNNGFQWHTNAYTLDQLEAIKKSLDDFIKGTKNE